MMMMERAKRTKVGLAALAVKEEEKAGSRRGAAAEAKTGKGNPSKNTTRLITRPPL